MTKADIARTIAEKLYDEDVLNAVEFGGDISTALRLAQEDIEYILQDYLIIRGEIVIGC